MKDALFKMMCVATALGVSHEEKPWMPPSKEQSERDFKAMEKAQAKRERKAAKLRGS